MTLFGRILCAALLIGIASSAAAENFKCKLPDGTSTYQDRPCDKNVATQEVVNASNGAVLAMSMSEAAMVGLRLGAKKASASGRMSPVVANCLSGMSNERFYTTFQHLLADNIDPADLKAANTFYNSPTGRKYSRRNVIRVYALAGESAPEQPPIMTPKEENEVSEFTSTPAGQTLITRRFLENAEALPIIVSRIQEISKECGKQHW